MEETGVPRENHRPRRKSLENFITHNFIKYTQSLTTLRGTDYIDRDYYLEQGGSAHFGVKQQFFTYIKQQCYVYCYLLSVHYIYNCK